MRRRGPVIGGVLAAAVVAAVAIVVLAWPDHSTPAKTATRFAPPKGAVIDGGGEQLLALLQDGEGRVFHATYAATGDPAAIGGSLTLEIWQSPPRVREDTVRTGGGHTTRTASYITGAREQLCVQADGAAWACKAPTTGSAGPTDQMLSSVMSVLSGQPVSITAATIGGRAAQCFQIGSTTGVKVCASSQGIPLLITDGQISYTLASLSTVIDKAVFTPPAAPGA